MVMQTYREASRCLLAQAESELAAGDVRSASEKGWGATAQKELAHMKASYLGAMGYAHRRDFPPTWPTPPGYSGPETSVQSYQDGMEECEFAEEIGVEWVSFSEHHYSGRIATGTTAVMAAAVTERCKTIKIAMLGPLMPLNNPVRAAEELTLLDNLTNGRLVMGFLRGAPNEDQVYGVNPAEGRGRMLEDWTSS